MTGVLGFAPEELAGLLEVISHPDHQRGLEDRFIDVERVESLAERFVRLVAHLSGDDALDTWLIPNLTVRLVLPGTPDELDGIDGAPQTTSRVYTIADVEPATRTVLIDFVRHPGSSPVMRWLDRVRPGDRIPIVGPRPHRIPETGHPWTILADSSAVPAALSIVQRMPNDHAIDVLAAVPADEFSRIETAIHQLPGEFRLTRVDPEAYPQGTAGPLSAAFARLEIPEDGNVWASGEREDMREIRRRCKHDLGLPAERMQVFGYWKRGTTNTHIDMVRLRAARRAIAEGRDFADTDDFEIGL